jgi:hypothetical protein
MHLPVRHVRPRTALYNLQGFANTSGGPRDVLKDASLGDVMMLLFGYVQPGLAVVSLKTLSKPVSSAKPIFHNP